MKKLLRIAVIATGLLALLLAAGCLGKEPSKRTGEGENKPPISDEPQETTVEVTLYFADDQAMQLVKEKRKVTKGDEPLEEVVIRELIKGPAQPGHNRTVPEETKLLSVSVVDGVAYVNFSKEFKTKHWGGSTGETMTLMSVTRTLCELEGIEKVQFLLEGDKMDTLAGHVDTSEPLEPSNL